MFNSKVNDLERKIKDLKETVNILDSKLYNLRKKESLEHKIDELKEMLEELIDKTGFEIRPDILVTKERLEKKSNKTPKGGD